MNEYKVISYCIVIDDHYCSEINILLEINNIIIIKINKHKYIYTIWR